MDYERAEQEFRAMQTYGRPASLGALRCRMVAGVETQPALLGPLHHGPGRDALARPCPLRCDGR
jgi:hypothetical protein